MGLEKKSKEPKKEEKKEKKSKSLFEKWFKQSKLKKPDTVAVVYLRNNGQAEMMECQVKRGFFNIDGITYHSRRDCTYTESKERKPVAIIREGYLTPIGTSDWEEKTIQEKCAELQDHAIKGIKNAELVRMGDKDQKKLNAKTAIGIAIAIIIVVAIIYGYK